MAQSDGESIGPIARKILKLQTKGPLQVDNPIQAEKKKAVKKKEKKSKDQPKVKTKKTPQKKGKGKKSVDLSSVLNDKQLAEAIGHKVLEAMLKK
jgi:hypothetical protein